MLSYQERLKAMVNAALTPEKLSNIESTFNDLNIKMISKQPIITDEEYIGMKISAQKL